MNKELNDVFSTKEKSIFAELYPFLNVILRKEGEEVNSRNGKTKELLNAVTRINPLYSCVGGQGRNINIFFLLAEALWIWSGRKDVAFLNLFNSRMKDYSDNGKTFHAPYGWRLRNWGVDSDTVRPEEDEAIHENYYGQDQIALQLLNLKSDPLTRQAVLNIWNPELDNPTVVTKDRPCNDILMYKIRNNKLIATIANRSNDLHWGLPTNVFQFSFIGKIIASILDVDYTSQCHLSQSLHYYLDNPIADRIYNNRISYTEIAPKEALSTLYDWCLPFRFNFNFEKEEVGFRLKETDFFISSIISILIKRSKGMQEDDGEKVFKSSLLRFSPTLYKMMGLLDLYISYKFNELDLSKALYHCLEKLLLRKEDVLDEQLFVKLPFDFDLLAFNFFFIKLSKASDLESLKNYLKYKCESILPEVVTRFYFKGLTF